MSLAAFYSLPKSTPATRWIRNHFDFPYDDCCLIWPFSRKGGGYAEISGQHLAVHRIMCEYRHGPAPSSKHHAAHSCGRGHDGCENPQHLNWRTPAENQLERYKQHGINPRYKLDWDQVEKIKALKDQYTADDVAAMFDITDSNVRLIWSGKTRTKKPGKVFTAEEIQAIRAVSWQEKSARQIAEEFGVSRGIIERIRQRVSYVWVPESVDPRLVHPSAECKSE